MKKFERRSKDERRRVLLNNYHELSASLDNEKLHNNIQTNAQVINRRFLAAVLALVFALSCMIVGIQLSAKADSNTPEITFDANGVYTVPTGGSLDAGTYRYVGPDSNEYAFTITDDLVPADTLTLDFSNRKVSVRHDYTVGAENILGYHKHDLPYGEHWINDTEWEELYYEGPLTTVDADDSYKLNINSSVKQHLDSSKTYYYQDPNEADTYYLINLNQDFGHVMQVGRSGFEEEKGLFKNASVKLNFDSNGNPTEPTLSGDYYKRHCYYIQTTALSPNSVYLIFGEAKNRSQLYPGNYLLRYSDDYSFDASYYDSIVGGVGRAGCANGQGQNRYAFFAQKVEENIDYKRFQNNDGITNNLYDTNLNKVAFSTNTTDKFSYSNRYFYGEDGSTELDPFVYSEFSTISRGKNHFWNWFRAKYALMAYDGNPESDSYGYYTDQKVLGTAYGNSVAKTLSVHQSCNSQAFYGTDHNHGDLWSYNWNNKQLRNDNTLIDQVNVSFVDDNFALRGYNLVDLLNENYNKYSDVYLFEMTYLYTQEDYDASGSVRKVSNKPTAVDLVELRKASITMDSTVAGDNTFDVDVTLINNEDPTSLVNGTYGDLTFVNGVATVNAMKDEDTINLRSIPSNFTLSVSPSTSDSSLSEDYSYNYSGTDQEAGEYTNIASLSENNRDIVITVAETGKDAHISLLYDGSDSTKEFPVTFSLKDKNGVPIHQSFGEGTDTITFDEDGVYSIAMKNGDKVDFTKLPFGSTLTASVTSPDGDISEYYSYTLSNDSDTSTPASATYTIDSEKTETVNVVDQRAPITVINHTTGTYANTSRAFPVDLTLKKPDDTTAETIALETTSGTSIQFTNGVYRVELAHDDSVTFILPKGYKLVASDEEEHPYYSTTIKVDDVEGDTAIAGNNNTIEIIRNRADAVDTGFTADSDSSNMVLITTIMTGAIASGAGVAYVYRKKQTE